MAQIPVIILKEGSTQTRGTEALQNNIKAASIISNIVKSSLGPRGMDKMLVDSLGEITITNDGATILKEIDVQHPAAKIMVEISKSTDSEVGDGTTSTVVLAGSLLENAEGLILQNIHPTVIVSGYKKAAQKALEFLKNLAISVDPHNRKYLLKISQTSLASKIVSSHSLPLSEIVVDAILSIAEKEGGAYKVDIDNIKVEKKTGQSILQTKLIKGIVLDKEIVNGAMPKRIANAKVALINNALEIEKTEFDAKIEISSPEQIRRFLDEEDKILKKMVDTIIQSGATVVLSQKGIDDLVQHYLARSGIIALRRVKESDMTKLAKATGARIITDLSELTETDLGFAELVEERKIEEDRWTFVEGCKNPKAVSILVRGGTQRVTDEAERSVHDALMAVKDVVEHPQIVVGGGAPEAYVSGLIREWSSTLEGRTQLAAEKFADSLEEIPLSLAENAGMDVIDSQVQLRSHREGTFGIDAFNKKVANLKEKEIFEPLVVKEQVINAATEAVCMILRIDETISVGSGRGTSNRPMNGRDSESDFM